MVEEGFHLGINRVCNKGQFVELGSCRNCQVSDKTGGLREIHLGYTVDFEQIDW